MYIRGNVHSAKCTFRQVPILENVHSGKCPFGQMYFLASVHSGKCTLGEMSIRPSVFIQNPPCPKPPYFFDAKNLKANKYTLYGTVTQSILKT